MNPIFQMLMQRLQNRDPKGYQFVNTAMQNGGNPNAILKQMLGDATPEQKQALIQQARTFGAPDNFLKQIQNIK